MPVAPERSRLRLLAAAVAVAAYAAAWLAPAPARPALAALAVSAAVATGPVKCGTIPTMCVSHRAATLCISVIPPTFGRVART
jgi:hypothetical protein